MPFTLNIASGPWQFFDDTRSETAGLFFFLFILARLISKASVWILFPSRLSQTCLVFGRPRVFQPAYELFFSSASTKLNQTQVHEKMLHSWLVGFCPTRILPPHSSEEVDLDHQTVGCCSLERLHFPFLVDWICLHLCTSIVFAHTGVTVSVKHTVRRGRECTKEINHPLCYLLHTTRKYGIRVMCNLRPKRFNLPRTPALPPELRVYVRGPEHEQQI